MKNKSAFTLIELLVVIAIIGLLATLSVIALNNARAKSRDAKRAADIKQMQTALELYFNDKGRYPTPAELNSGSIFSTTSDSTTTYMKIIPSAPTPADGGCSTAKNSYKYNTSLNGDSYSIAFCLGGNVANSSAGDKCATPGGVLNGQSNNACDPILNECGAGNGIGDICGGGVLFSTTTRLIASPSHCMTVDGGGCDNTFATTDLRSLPWDNSGSPIANSATNYNDGRINVQAVKTANGGVVPANIAAIKFCDDLTVNGFSDFYLPAYYETFALMSNSLACNQCTTPSLCGCKNGSATNPIVKGIPYPSNWNVWLSSESSASVGQWLSYTGSFAGGAKSNYLYLRCVRRY